MSTYQPLSTCWTDGGGAAAQWPPQRRLPPLFLPIKTGEGEGKKRPEKRGKRETEKQNERGTKERKGKKKKEAEKGEEEEGEAPPPLPPSTP